MGRGRYVEVAGARHEVIMEVDDLRAAFLREFDAMADYLAPRGSQHAEGERAETAQV